MKPRNSPILGYLRFFRIDSASAPMTYLVLGYLLGGGGLLSGWTVLWLLFGLVFQMAGFGDNNVQDIKHDLADPNKSSFPLGRSIPLDDARRLVIGLHLLGLAFALLLSGSLTAASIFGVSYASGIAYNRTSKARTFAPFLFGLTFAPLALFSYFATAGQVGPMILLVAALCFLECLFQNSVATSLKDVDADSVNFMKRLGARLESGRLIVPRIVKPVTYAIKGFEVVLLVGLATFSLPLMVIFGTAFLLFSLAGAAWTIRSRPWEERRRLMLQAAVSEIGLFYAVVGFLLIELGPISSFFVAAFPLIWYVAVKRVVWGPVSRVMS
ncbi:MAG TPA: UbiA family prenyltransferase [Nitrososphaerales archaeon]|nr:UbiA family prenyltransferase [Nitrososphaerales archaeon]